jgi:hypothetical protein
VKEIHNVRQHPEERRRRWFCDEDFELIVWFEEPETIVRFELSYDIQRNWRALRWSDRSGFSHHFVDDGEDRPHRNATPMLIPSLDPPPVEMFAAFEARGRSLEPSILSFVCDRLTEYRAQSAS